MAHKHSWLFALGVLLTLFGSGVGCNRNPTVRKQKFLEQGNQDFNWGKFPEAIIFYSRALQIDPRFTEAHHKLAQCYLKQGSWALAYHELTATVELEPQNWQVQTELGQILLAAGKGQEAKDRALLVLRGNPRDSDAQVLLSRADAKLGNIKEALQEAQEAVQMSPERSSVYLNLGNIQVKAKQSEGAEVSLKKAQTLDPVSILPLLNLGNYYQQQQRWGDAEAEYKAAIRIAPKNSLLRVTLARLYLDEGQDALAENTLAEAKQQLKDDRAGYQLLGDYYIARGETSKALQEFQSLHIEHPDDVQSLKFYIQLLLLNHKLDDAKPFLDEILTKSPRDPEALVLKAQFQLQQAKIDESIQTLQQALKDAPGSAIGHYQMGLAYRLKGISAQAESEFHEATLLQPNLVDAWKALADSAIQRKDWRTLETYGEQLKTIAPRNPEGYLLHASARMNQGDAAGAEADLNHLIEMAPQSSLGYVKLGQLRASQGRLDDAEKMYRAGLSRDSNSIDAVQGLVDLYFRRNKSDAALHTLQEKIEHDPGNVGLYLLQGEALLQVKQPAEAAASFKRALELDKQNVPALILLAKIESSAGEIDQAIANYRQALAAAPTNIPIHLALGSLLESKGNWQEAQSIYEKALAIQPEDALAANNLAYVMLEHGGSVNVALTLAQTARRGLPQLPNSADTLGWAYYKNGAFSVAASLFEEAVRKVPNNQTYHYHLGLTYKKLNDTTRAKVELERTIALGPNSAVATRARQALTEPAGD